jgi:HEAT repeat protein
MTKTFAELKTDLTADDLAVRMKVLPASRSLGIDERFALVCMAVNDSNSRIRYDAISQLSSLGAVDMARTQSLLKEALWNDPELDVRAAAADSIGALKIKDLFPELQGVYAQTSDWLLQFSVVASLGELGDDRAYDLLLQALHHENDLVKTAAIGSLGELGKPEAVAVLIPLADHPDWQIRYRLAQALATLGGEQAQITLQKLQSDADPNVATMAKTVG